MSGMRRSDRRTSSDDNALRYPHPQRSAPPSIKELQSLLMTVRSQKDDAKKEAEANHNLYQQAHQQLQSTIVLYEEAQCKVTSYIQLYDTEKARNSELQAQCTKAREETEHYRLLYQQSESDLKAERRSKAGIKGWETRRRRENERLKAEIGEMAILLRESLERKEEAINHLEDLAARMDRIQDLVDSVEGESANNPVGLLQKLQRVWQAIKEILGE